MRKCVLFEISHCFMVLLVLGQFLDGKSVTRPNVIFVFSLEYLAHSKTILLRGVLYNNVYFLKYCTFLWFCRTLPIFWGVIQTSSKSNFYGSYGLNGPLKDYFANGYAVLKCLFFEILHLFYDFVEFLQLKSRLRLNGFFMFVIG